MASPSALNRPSHSHDLEAKAMDSEIPALDTEGIQLIPISGSHVWETGHHDENVTNSGSTLAQSNDEALVKTWDKNMKGISFFAGLLALGLPPTQHPKIEPARLSGRRFSKGATHSRWSHHTPGPHKLRCTCEHTMDNGLGLQLQRLGGCKNFSR